MPPRTILQPGRVFLTCDIDCSARGLLLKESFQLNSPSDGGRLKDSEGKSARFSVCLPASKSLATVSAGSRRKHRSQIRDQPPCVLGHFLSGQSFEKAQPRLALLKSSVRRALLCPYSTHNAARRQQICNVPRGGYHARHTSLDHHLLTQSSSSVGNQFFGPLPPTVAESLL
jgi:hypothetical protein